MDIKQNNMDKLLWESQLNIREMDPGWCIAKSPLLIKTFMAFGFIS